MYKQLLFTTGLLISSMAIGQNAATPKPIESNPQTITVQHQTSIEYIPDEIQMKIVLLEYLKTDPETQQTSTIEMTEIEKQLLEKIKPYGLDKSDLSLSDISDQVQNTNNNGFGYAQPIGYNSTQKRLIRKTYALTWTKSTNELQPFMESLRFNGIQSIYLNAETSNRKTKELEEDLLEKVMEESKNQAELIALNTKKSVGEIVSCNINPNQIGSYATSAYPMNYGNYTNFYGSNNASLNKSEMMMTVSVVYELK